MTSKRVAGRAVRRGRGGPSVPTEQDRSPKIFDITQIRIEAFNRENGGGVSVRKLAHGYTLFRDDNGAAVARLRSRDDGRKYEVLRRGDAAARWQSLGPPALVLPLDDALEYIAEDPLGVFWR
jgi:hypothetical protein